MPRIRTGGGQRWANRTAAATPDYQAGVANPRVGWQQATVAAAEAHKAATIDALSKGRFAQGVQKAGDGKWQRNAQGKGAERFGPGAAAAVGDYEQGFAPYAAVIEGLQLPPRGPKGDPKNIARVAAIASALRKKKTGSVSFALALCLGVVSAGLLVGAIVHRRCQANNASGGDKAGLLVTASPEKHSIEMGLTAIVVGVTCVACFMGAALDVITVSAIAPGAAGAAGAAVLGDSLAVRNVPFGQEPQLLTCWVKSQVSGFLEIKHPSGHDQVRDLRMRHVATANLPLFAPGWAEPAEPQESFTVNIAGSAVAGQIELLHMLMYYPQLPGIDARLIDLPTLEARWFEQVTIEDTTTSTVAGSYSGSRALNAASDLLIANTDYAILGAHIGALTGVLTIKGADLGNLRVGIPGMNGRPDLTAMWFPWLSQEFGLPLIPVINSANKAAIFVENVQDQTNTAVPFSLLLARLTDA